MPQIDEERRRRALSLSKCLEEIAVARGHLMLQLEDLDARARVVQLEYDMLWNLHAPTSNLPDEILAMIFEAGIWLEEDSGPHFGELVSHVSRRWRSIALATPRLWARIQCFRDNGGQDEYLSEDGEWTVEDVWLEKLGWHERVASHLSRSKSSLVDIHIKGLRNEDFTDDFRELISGHLGHCRRLSTENIPSRALQMLSKLLKCQPVPRLRSLTLTSEEATLFDGQFKLFPSGAPCLLNASFQGIVNAHMLLSPFSSIKSLRITDILIRNKATYDSFRDGLMALKALTHVELGLQSFGPLSHAPPILLPTIQFLRVGAGNPGSRNSRRVNAFVNTIQAAALISLSLDGWDSRESDQWVAHYPSLQHLILQDITMSEPNLRTFAAKFPDIERLTVRSYREINFRNVLSSLTLSTIGTEDDATTNWLPWPKLGTLAISAVHMPENDRLLLPGQIIRLQQLNHPFRKLLVPLCFFETAGAELTARLKELVEIGDFNDDWPTPFE